MLYIFPIEPLEERYSADWLRWVKSWARNNHLDYFVVEPYRKAYEKIETGQFLDVVGTNVYKAQQLQIISKIFSDGRVCDGDIFWVHDLWFPGIEMLAYIRDGLGLNIKIYGMLHAGTYDPNDFIYQKGMWKWGRDLEKSWINMCDGVFVATNYHKKLITNTLDVCKDKIHVVPFPLCWQMTDFDYAQKENIVVFPHRLAPEKGIDKWSEFAELAQLHGFTCLRTKDVCKTKAEYYDLLLKAKFAVSFARQETWGIAMQEAILCGCIPIMPDALSYHEMYIPDFLYEPENVVEAMKTLIRLNYYCKNATTLVSETCTRIYRNGWSAFDVMYELMRG